MPGVAKALTSAVEEARKSSLDPIVRKASIGHAGIVFRTSQEGEECLDTTVTIGGEYLCTICNADIDAFLDMLRSTVQRFEK